MIGGIHYADMAIALGENLSDPLQCMTGLARSLLGL